MSIHKLLTFPDAAGMALSIRAKAMLFHDPRSVALLQEVERIAETDATVLLVGETGTGKELVARHIHACSGREGPFLAVNCGAFSETLIDAELFGHEAGAYTGAGQARAGWFEAANGGTLFLDEIGDLPLALQVKLLRVLQERQVVRLGSRRTVSLDVRLVAATNVDLRRAVEATHFRADLYYRLSVAAIDLPPLRDRRGDILPLARHFMSQHAGRLALTGPTLAPAAEAALLSYSWPGNIRELENVIHYALIVCKQGVLQRGDLRFSPLSPVDVPARHAANSEPPLASDDAVVDAEANALDPLARELQALIAGRRPHLMRDVEGLLVRLAYSHCDENQVRAARLLGISRNSMRTLLARYALLQRPGVRVAGAVHESDVDHA